MSVKASQSPATRLFVVFFQQFIHANNKQTSKLDILGPLWTEHSSDRRIRLTKDQ